MSIFDQAKKRSGAKPKHNLELMQVGEVKAIPEDVKISSMRSIAYSKGVDNGMKFSVNAKNKTVERVA